MPFEQSISSSRASNYCIDLQVCCGLLILLGLLVLLLVPSHELIELPMVDEFLNLILEVAALIYVMVSTIRK